MTMLRHGNAFDKITIYHKCPKNVITASTSFDAVFVVTSDLITLSVIYIYT